MPESGRLWLRLLSLCSQAMRLEVLCLARETHIRQGSFSPEAKPSTDDAGDKSVLAVGLMTQNQIGTVATRA